MTKIIKIKNCVDCFYKRYNKYLYEWNCRDKKENYIVIPESGIHKDCKLEDYKVKK